MTPTRSESNYSISSNGSGLGTSSHKSKRQECHCRGEAQMEDARTSTSSQRLASTFNNLILSPKAEITAITVVRLEPFPTGTNRDIPVSVQELVYGRKGTEVRASSKSLDRHDELLSSSEEVDRPRKDRGSSEGLDTHILQSTSQTDKSLVEKPKHFVQGREREVVPRKGQKPSARSSNLQKKNQPQQVPNKEKQSPKSNQKGKAKSKWKSLTHRITKFQRERRKPCKMCSIWQEL
ncbi:hypothetical protein O181_093848 [Austropuccinia psidii MF-1]|uniref:Uncharacterized protein n=1 Tax=Austropuccinia psidii MF-1 TaxID=1389203 RepID=A0A9Q3P9Q6_9BASI|nr:hypothetical protein [Austropuccinia psidii MF-1]